MSCWNFDKVMFASMKFSYYLWDHDWFFEYWYNLKILQEIMSQRLI